MNQIVSRETKTTSVVPYCCCGGPEGIRTPDLRNANATLYQLSYRPTKFFYCPYPPSTFTIDPVIKLASSEARKTITFAISSGRASL